MNDDEILDDVLRAAMSGPPPQTSRTFVEDIQRRTAPRRLTPVGRIVMVAYVVAAVACCVWALRDAPGMVTAIALGLQLMAAVMVGSYTRALALRRL